MDSVNMFAEDNDIVVLLLHYWKTELEEIYVIARKSGRTWSISRSAEKANEAKQFL